MAETITILVDNDSWIVPYAKALHAELAQQGYDATFVKSAESVRPGWISFLIGCTRLVGQDILQRNRHNLVVHESALPKGRGFAPMAWQILEGRREIEVCLLEAAAEVDAGPVWLRDRIKLTGYELCDEWRALQGEMTKTLCLRFVREYEHLTAQEQRGEPSYYPRRRLSDSELDTDRSLRDQFNLLRIVDNQRYPAFFEIDGHWFRLRIEPLEKPR